MACDEITIEAVPPDLHAKLLEQGTAAGAKFDGETAEIDGIGFLWRYDADTQTAHIICVKKPFFISCGSIEQRIRELVRKAAEGI